MTHTSARPFRRAMAVGAAASAIVLGTAAAAVAGPPWTVSVGGSSTGAPAPYTATAAGVGFFVSGLDLECDTSTGAGAINPGPTSGLAGTIGDVDFTGCLGPLGIDMDVETSGTWDIVITGDNVGGQTPGEIRGIQATATSPEGLCSFDVAGTAVGVFDEGTQALSVTGPSQLTVSNVENCFGLILDGDAAEFVAEYALSGIAPVTIQN